MRNHLCGLLAGIGLMLGSTAHAEVYFEDADAHSALSTVATFSTSAAGQAVAHDKGWFAMDDLSLKNVSALPEPGAATLLVIAVLALGVVRARSIP